jgi:hypothetical protein
MEPTAEERYQEAREADLARQRQWKQQERQYQYTLEEDRTRQRQWTEADLARQHGKTEAGMGWGIFLIALLLSLVADAAEFFTLGTFGWFVGLVVDLILMLMLGLSAAGQKQFKKWIWGPAIETIPILSALPFIRVAFLTWSFVSSRSKKLRTAAKIASAGLSKRTS